jgi:hypothetical protein
MGHLNHIAIKTNTNSLFFQENEEVNQLGEIYIKERGKYQESWNSGIMEQ